MVVTHENEAHIDGLVQSLAEAADGLPLRVVVVDNASTDATVSAVRAAPGIDCVALSANRGYAAGINAGCARVDADLPVLVLNADLRLRPGSITRLLAALEDPEVGIAVPALVDADGARAASLRREPSLLGALGDALFGGRWRTRPSWLSEIVWDPEAYRCQHDVDWATGAALLVSHGCDVAVGAWNEEFFLYSEEVDYCARARDAGFRIRYVPDAEVQHLEGGSGRTPALTALLARNRVRYYHSRHGRPASSVFRRARAAPRAAAGGRGPASARAPDARDGAGAGPVTPRASVVIPAHNESAVLARGLRALLDGFRPGELEIVVVCNGCDDGTAIVARQVRDDVHVIELDRASKPAALRAGDQAVGVFPRVYLDADVVVPGDAVRRMVEAVGSGPALAARPPIHYDTSRSSTIVRRYYAARVRTRPVMSALWGAGVYTLSAEGRARFGEYPDVVAEDLFVGARFAAHEFTIVDGPAAVVVAPRTTSDLLRVLRRGAGGAKTGRGLDPEAAATTATTMRHLARQPAAGAGPALDAAVYASLAVAARVTRYGRRPTEWERDESSRVA